MRMQNALIAGLLLALFTGGEARAAVIFDNLSTTTQGFSSLSDTAWEGTRFNSDTTNLVLTSATLTLFAGTQGSGTFFLRLYSDSANQPGISLATLFTGANPFPGPTYP